ncbi:unnamed protein product [Plutella xylostella]|uniref:(diamondback moth) hypothetical protein n=1 Tax=Plutella xylostella TaxID=51655 RepID=A0A8S4FKU7_PLUXY|nr:unnamed protein product [Plutella xylostella]
MPPRPPRPARPPLSPARCRMLAEAALRLLLVALFLFLNTCVQPARRDVAAALRGGACSRPRRRSLVPPALLLPLLLLPPLAVVLLPLALGERSDVTPALLAWTLAMSANAVATEALKLSVGRPRPDFLYRCFPDGRPAAHVPPGRARSEAEGRKSFPSGHSSFSFCSLGFVSLYVCGRLGAGGRAGRGARLAAGAGPLALAAALGASRWVDHHHHAGDVAAGAALGLALAAACYRRYYPPLYSDRAGIPYELDED